MKREYLIKLSIGGVVVFTCTLIVLILTKHFEQTEPLTQKESSPEGEVALDGSIESTSATKTAQSEESSAYGKVQSAPDTSSAESANEAQGNDGRSADAYRAFQGSHVPYSRSIADVFPYTGTPAYKLEYKGSDSHSGCTGSNTITLTKLDMVSKRYSTLVEDICVLVDELWFLESGMDLTHAFYPVWSRNERYVAFVDAKTFTFDIFNPETAERLIFIDSLHLEKGLQEMQLPGVTTDGGPTLNLDFSTVRKTEDGHVQMIGIGKWRPPLETYVYVFDFTDWSLKQILDINPDKDFLIGREWAGERAVRVYTVSTDAVKRCEKEAIGGSAKLPWLPSSYYDCHKINFSNFTQMEIHTISF